ncbi:MAG: NAD(P)-dependent oxidoreductase [Alphaproteobacteria bacterium]|nr:NAD(P)-dependent oxidoreductase [Alphaproteobacteria bacterium]
MKVLITGAGGFLGRHLAIDLARQGFDVVATYRGAAPAGVANAVRLDLVTADGLPAGVEAVVHAAATSAWAGVSAAAMARDNVEATRRLIELATKAGARRFVFCSSMSAFGDIKSGSVDESTPVADPDVYGMTKLIGEALLGEAAPGLSGLALRLPAVIGPGAKRNFLAEALRKMKAGEDVSIFNPDAPFNNAVHCADLGALVAGALRRGWQGYDMLVLGAAGMTTIRGAVERLKARMRSRSAIVVRAAGKGAFTLDSARAVSRFGYAPMEIAAMLDRYADEEGAGKA